MYCSKPGHIATNCNLGKRPGTSLCQMDSILEDSMDKLSIHDSVEANKLSTNSFAVLDMDVEIKTLSILNMDLDNSKNLDVANINHLSF